MLRSICWTLFFALYLGTLFAQQKAQYSQYMFNPFMVNAAVVGLEDFADVKTGYRNQWAGLDGSPKTFYVSGHLALGKPDRTSALPTRGRFGRSEPRTQTFRNQQSVPGHYGVGGYFLRDQTGPTSRTSISFTGARHFSVTNTAKLSVGLGAGVTQHTLDFDQLRLLNPADALGLQGKTNVITPELRASAMFYTQKFYVGASAEQLFFKNINYRNSSGYQWLGKLYQHYFLMAGYRHDLSANWAVVPSVLVKAVRPTPVSFDINAKILYQDRLWMGASYRHKDAVVGMVGFNISQLLNVGYSYDFTLSNLNTVSRGSHEIVVGVMLNNRQKLICPRLY